MKRHLSFLLIICLLSLFSFNLKITDSAMSTINSDCSFKGKKLYGRIQFVSSFPDIKVQVVNAFPDLRVQMVNAFPDKCGMWQEVNSFPDLKVQIVNSFPDIKIQYVNSFPGKP